MRRATLLTPLLCLLLGACKVGPDYERPDLSARTDAAWRQPASSVITGERVELARWWQRLGSDELSMFVGRLLRQNLSLAEARQRIVAARAQRGIVDADRLPTVAGGAGYTRAGTGDRSLNFQGPPPGQDVDVYGASVTANWELDLWGRVARLTEAADADIDVAVEDYRAAAVSLLAELALAYVDADTLHARTSVLDRNLALQQETVRLALSRLDAGSGARLDVEQARRELATTQALRPELSRLLAAAENRIAVLIGERPQDNLVAAVDTLTLPPAVGIGIPADLLLQRADVRRSERRLAAAVARIGAAEAERYPSLSISGTLALRARDVDTLGHGADAVSYSFGPNLTVPLFTGGRIDSAVVARTATATGERATFERSLLEAISEVENAAAGVARSRERVAALEAAAAAAEATVTLAQQLYTAGSRSLLQVVDAERAQVAAADNLLLARQAALSWTINLYRALGGGWQPIGLDGSLPGAATAEGPQKP